jgi:hypothetical protein
MNEERIYKFGYLSLDYAKTHFKGQLQCMRLYLSRVGKPTAVLTLERLTTGL